MSALLREGRAWGGTGWKFRCQAGRSPRDGGDLDTPQEWAEGGRCCVPLAPLRCQAGAWRAREALTAAQPPWGAPACISYSTAHRHIESIYRKLHVHSRTHAVANYWGLDRRWEGRRRVDDRSDGPDIVRVIRHACERRGGVPFSGIRVWRRCKLGRGSGFAYDGEDGLLCGGDLLRDRAGWEMGNSLEGCGGRLGWLRCGTGVPRSQGGS